MAMKNPILVTGSHRSGTTWVGKMLALPARVVYIHEPFNLNCTDKWFKTNFENWFTYVTNQNEQLYYNEIKKIIELRYELEPVIKVDGDWKRASVILKRYMRFLYHRWSGHTPLLKDPIAVFSAEWLYQRFDAKVVIMIRHPAAFAGSLKKTGWSHPFTHFLNQHNLMEDYLEPFYNQIVDYAQSPPDIIDQAILLWRIIYSVVRKYRERHEDWIFLRHEDISREPIDQFAKLYNTLGLRYSPSIQETILDHTLNKVDHKKKSYSLKRNSKTNIWNWKNRLTQGEVKRIRERVEGISSYFYTDEDWGGY
jgi:hypothetical protein